MANMTLFGARVEIDEAVTRAWYAQAESWDCRCARCRNFLALARKRALPAFVLEPLDRLGIAPEKATFVCSFASGKKSFDYYEVYYRLAGAVLQPPASPASGDPRCGEATCPEFDFPDPHFDLQFSLTLPWVLNEPAD